MGIKLGRPGWLGPDPKFASLNRFILGPLNKVQYTLPTLGLIRAWDPGMVTGTDITSIPAAFNTAAAMTLSGTSGTSDIIQNLSPSLRHMLRTTSSNNERGAILTTGSMTAFTLAFIWAPTSGVNVPIASLSTSTTNSYLRIMATSNQYFRLEFRPNSGSAAQINFNTSGLMNIGSCYLVVITLSGGTISVRVNGVAAGSSASGGGSYTFDQFFKSPTAVTAPGYATAFWGRIALWNRVLLSPEISGVESALLGFGDDIARALYVSNSVGDDTTNYGFSSTTPVKTIAKATNKTQIITNGLAIDNFYILLKGNDTWTGEVISPPVSGTASKRLIFDTYGSGRANLEHVAAIVGGWTDNGNGSLSRTQAAQPFSVRIRVGSVLADPRGTFYESYYNADAGGTAPSIRKFTWAATVLTIWPAPGFDANTTEVRIATIGTRCVDTSSVHFDLWHINMWFYGGIAFKPSGTGGTIGVNSCDASYGSDDGMDIGGSVVVTFFDCDAHSNGRNPGLSGQGDGFSIHSGSTAVYIYCRAYYNRYGGWRSEAHTRETLNRCHAKGNCNDIMRLAQGTSSGGYLNIYNTLIELTAQSIDEIGIELETGLTGATFEFAFLTIVDKTNSATSTAIACNGSVGGTVKNSIISKFHNGVISVNGVPVAEDYNCFHDVFTRVNGGAASSGGHSIIADPLFTDAANDNYTLQVGSPCIGAGTPIVAAPNDFNDIIRDAVHPCIGAYERLAA